MKYHSQDESRARFVIPLSLIDWFSEFMTLLIT